MVDPLDVAAGEALDAPAKHPFLNTVRGRHHLTLDMAIVKPSEKEPDKVYGIIEYTTGDDTKLTYMQHLNAPGWAGKYSRGRFKNALLAAMNEADPGDAGYKAFLSRALTDQGGEAKGGKVTAIVTPSKDPKYNDVTFEPGHTGESSVAEDTPPPVVETVSPEDKAKAAGYIQNGDTEWYYHPETKDQRKLSSFA